MNWNVEYEPQGMGLRDQFAGQAMQSLISHHRLGQPCYFNGIDSNEECERCDAKLIAKLAYLMADAMIEAREVTA